MSKAYVVCRCGGEYEDFLCIPEWVFDTREAAQAFADARTAEWQAEYDAGLKAYDEWVESDDDDDCPDIPELEWCAVHPVEGRRAVDAPALLALADKVESGQDWGMTRAELAQEIRKAVDA